MLTDQEVNKIFSWLPYRSDWPVDRNQREDNIEGYYGGLVNTLTQNQLFDTYFSEDGGLGNYLEFICYPKGHNTYEGSSILVCVSLCAPVAAYGQISISKKAMSFGWSGLFSAEEIGNISDHSLSSIEIEVKNLLLEFNLSLLDKEFASKTLPDELIDSLRYENHNEGNQYLHGIFQKTD
jgi:hypothetical protein